MNRQGERNDLTLTPSVSKLRTNEILGQEVGESREQIRRYIRLTELIPEMLELVDEGKIGLRPAVEISYLPPDLQEELLDNMEMEACTPNHAQTLRMRVLLKDGKLTPESIAAIMQEEKPNQREKIILRDDRTRKLLPKDLSPSKREEYIIAALEYYAKFRARQRDMER
jgi:ParB family chromosome partitioning protein